MKAAFSSLPTAARRLTTVAALAGVFPALVNCSGSAGSAALETAQPGQSGQTEDSGSGASGSEDGGNATPIVNSPPGEDGGAVSPQGANDAGGPPKPSADGGSNTDSGVASTDSGAGSQGADASTGAPLGKVVGGYYPNWTPSPVRIRDVDPHYNVIYLFAATPVGGSPGTTGAIEWTPPGDGLGAATNLNADIAYARASQGRKIILSVGGAGNAISFPARSKSQAFVTSVASLYTQLGGFDGLDWDSYEGSDSPDTTEMIWISLQLKSLYPGFLITTPPAPWSTVDQTFCAAMVSAGALDYAAPQYYDGPNLATQAYIVPSVDTWSSLLGESKMVVGFGIADATNYMTVAQVIATWDAVNTNHPNLGGAFDWEIDVDQASGWPFADQVGPLIAP